VPEVRRFGHHCELPPFAARRVGRVRLRHVMAQPGRPARLHQAMSTAQWHGKCESVDCLRRCRRPKCLEPGNHIFARAERQGKKWVSFHQLYDCTVPRVPLGLDVASAARQAIAELRPELGPREVALARKVISAALDRLEALQQTTVTVVEKLPLLLPEHKRPHVVAAPREITHARAQHQHWLDQRKERTA
jgi:hypothetical protein